MVGFFYDWVICFNFRWMNIFENDLFIIVDVILEFFG